MELRAVGLLVQPVDDDQRPLDLVALDHALGQRAGAVGRRQFGDLQLAAFAFQPRDVPGDPVRLVAALADRLPDGLAVDGQADLGPAALAGAELEAEVVVLDRDVLDGFDHAAAPIRLHDVVDVDVAPAAGLLVHDLDHGLLAGPGRDVPRVPFQSLGAARLVVGAGGGVDHLAIHQQVDAGAAGMHAAADQEVEVLAFDLQRRRGECAGRAVALEEAVDQPLAFEPADLHLARQRPAAGPGPNASPVVFQSP